MNSEILAGLEYFEREHSSGEVLSRYSRLFEEILQ